MKPMIAIIALGVSFTLFMLYMGKSKPDGVVVQKPYEAGIIFEETLKDIESVKNVVDNISIAQNNSNLVVTFEIFPDRSKYKTITVEKVLLEPLMDKPIGLEKTEKGYLCSSPIKQGFYNLKVFLNVDNKVIETKRSVYVEQVVK